MSNNTMNTEDVAQDKEVENTEIANAEEDIDVSEPIQSAQPKKSLTAEEAAKKIKKLSEENKEWRKEQREQKRLLEETQVRLKEIEVKNQERLINAEIKVISSQLKLRDFTDAKKLADLSTVKVLENGDVTGVKEALESLKKSKPYLFDLGNTSALGNAPLRTQQLTKSVRDMSSSEYKAAKAELFRHRI